MGKLLALQAVGSRRRGELRLFGPISRMDGFLEQLSAAISELRAYRHRPEGLAAVAELLKDEGPVADKLHDLALLYRRLRRLCRTAVSRSRDHPRPGL